MSEAALLMSPPLRRSGGLSTAGLAAPLVAAHDAKVAPEVLPELVIGAFGPAFGVVDLVLSLLLFTSATGIGDIVEAALLLYGAAKAPAAY